MDKRARFVAVELNRQPSSQWLAKSAVKIQAQTEPQPKLVVPATSAEAFPMPVRRIPIAD